MLLPGGPQKHQKSAPEMPWGPGYENALLMTWGREWELEMVISQAPGLSLTEETQKRADLLDVMRIRISICV